MLLGLGGYNPNEIRRKRREQKEKKKGKKKLRLLKANEEGPVGDATRPEGKLGYLFDAARFVYEASLALDQVEAQFTRLRELCRKALDLTLADTERKSINRHYIGQIRNYDYAVKQAKINDEEIFTGKFNSEPKELTLDGTDSRVMSFSFKPLLSDKMRLHITKVESIVSARKAEKAMDEVEKEFEKIRSQLTNKETLLKTMFTKEGAKMPNFKEIDEAKASGKAPAAAESEEVDEQSLEARSPEFIVLKKRQTRAAQAKGRSYALLINLKV